MLPGCYRCFPLNFRSLTYLTFWGYHTTIHTYLCNSMRIHRNLPVYPSGWSGWLGFVLSTKGPQSQGANGSGVASTLGLLRLPSKKQLAISGRIVSSRLRSWFVFQIPSSAAMSTRHEQPPLNLEGGYSIICVLGASTTIGHFPR